MANICDVAIVGGGILGLWAAKYASDAGLKTVLLDANTCGSGGSNGVLGALLPHLPNAMNDKKRFQFDALHEQEALIRRLEEQTGLSVGYERCGRLMPVRATGFLKNMQRCVLEAPDNWRGAQDFRFELIETAPHDNWINPELAPLGLAFDNLSARVAPRLLTRALKAVLADRVKIMEGAEFVSFDEQIGEVSLRDGTKVIAKNLVLAAGWRSYDLLRSMTGFELGAGVKGNAILFHLDGVADKPILYDNGTYVVPHADGHVAAGSTSANDWHDEHQVDDKLCADLVERAKNLCPALQNLEPISQWAGVRPRCHAKDPMVGRLAAGSFVHILTGGFKISFGIAHRLARALVERLMEADNPIHMPESYEPAYHLAEAEKRQG